VGDDDRLAAAYVLPLRWAEGGDVDELAGYLRWVSAQVEETIVVDGSPAPVFAAHAAAFGASVRHLPPDPDLGFAMGKVNGVITGLRACSRERVVIADDDVRYDRGSLQRTVELLGNADLVRPQNYFDQLPWHARWDTARSLLNRVFTGDPALPVGDFPGTLAVRRSSFHSSGAYDGDALFENLELIRTVQAAGGTVHTPLDLYVARRPPSTAHFLSQRVRQAYDDFAIPARMGVWLSILPATAWLLARRRGRWVGAGAAASVALAELGRRRANGRDHFPPSGSLLAPAWLTERAICSWLAVGAKARGGVRYGEVRLPVAGNSVASLSERKPIVL
jgi:hypothetical protein